VFGHGDNVLRGRTIFALAWFHAVVQERRIFIPQGWCKFYEFSDSDLKAGLQVALPPTHKKFCRKIVRTIFAKKLFLIEQGFLEQSLLE
jgi:hypothetical protein